MTILLLREALGTNYRDTVNLIELLEPIRDLLQLEQVPTIHDGGTLRYPPSSSRECSRKL